MSIYLIPKGQALQLEQVRSIDEDDIINGRTACPFHKGDSQTVLSIDLENGGFKCFKPSCAVKGIAVDQQEFNRLKQQEQEFKTRKTDKPLDLDWDDFSIELDKPNKSASEPDFSKIVREHIYTDEQGAPVHRTIYYATKDGQGKIPFQHHYKDGKWVSGLNGIKKLPYNLSNILNYDTLIYVEGEKDVDTFFSMGIQNATTLGSANSKLDEHNYKYFANKTVIIIPDKDEPGKLFADYLSNALEGVAKEIYICSLPHLIEGSGQDFSDLISKYPILKDRLNQTNIVQQLLLYSKKYEPAISFADFVEQYKQFPMSVYDRDLQAYIREVADVMSVPEDWIGGAILAVSSSLLGNKVKLDCGFANWTARPYFSYITVCQNGSNKTHPILKVLEYIFQQDQNENKIYREKKKSYDNKMYQAKKDKSASFLPEKPVRKRYFISDSTLEQVSKALNDNPNGLLWYMNEIAALFNGLGQYKSKSNDNERFIDLLDGINISVMRGDLDIDVSNPYINILGTTQPQVIRDIMSNYKDNGLAYRFCFCYLPKQNYVVKDNTDILTKAYLSSYFNYLQSVPENETVFTFDLEAKELAKQIINNEFNKLDKLSKGDPIISGIISKIRTQFINFCLLLHCSKNHKDITAKMTIDSNTVKQAFRLSMYYLYHNYITLFSSADVSDLEYNKIKKHCQKKKTDTIKVRDLKNYVFQKLKSEEIKALLSDLENRGKGFMIDDTTFKVSA